MGCNRLGEAQMPDAHWIDLVQQAIDLGVNLFDTSESYGWGRSEAIIGEAIAAVLLLLVANGIMRGSSGIRLLVAIVQCFAMGLAIYVLVVHHTGGLVYRGVFSLFVGVFVLWALYGNEESDRYFETNG